MKKTQSSGQGLRIFWLFCCTVLFLVLISLIVKGYTIIQKSLFDGTHRFTILQENNPVRLYSFAPDTNTISIVDIASQDKKKVSLQDIPVPIDATVMDKPSYDAMSNGVDPYLQNLFFHINDTKTAMTPLDLFRLWLFARSVDPTEIVSEKIQIQDFNKVATELFIDDAIVKENLSIQVVNASGVSGRGNDFSHILTNMGGNVVSVITAKKDSPKTTIQYYGQSSYTVKKLEKIVTKTATVSKKPGISDIVITLGKERIGK